jgi:hypothetical protein
VHPLTRAGDGAPKRYPAKFRRKVLDLFASGRPEAEAQVAYDLQICAQRSSATRGGRQKIDSGPDPCRRPVERHTSQRHVRSTRISVDGQIRATFLVRSRTAKARSCCEFKGGLGVLLDQPPVSVSSRRVT